MDSDSAILPPADEAWWQSVFEDEWRFSQGSNDGSPTPSRPAPRVESMEDWAWARELFERDDTVELLVVGYNRGGLLVQARGLRGFVPVSHLETFDPSASEEERQRSLADLVGRELSLKVIEFDPERGRLVFSERAAKAGPGRRLELLSRLQPGDTVRGTVTNVLPFGVFVDLGGVEGLIHVSELSWGRVRHPADVVRCGEELEVKVLSVDPDTCKVALSLKDLLPDPWDGVETRYQLGQVVEGTVTNVVKFGAFVEVEEGLEGLIHVSEIGDVDPAEVLREGERVRARIIHIDAGSRRLGLSLRDLEPTEEAAWQDDVADPEASLPAT